MRFLGPSRCLLLAPCLALLSACAGKPAARTPDQEKFETKLTQLVQQSQKTLNVCDEYRRAALQALQGVRQDGSFVAESAQALASVEKLIPRYPGAPKAYFGAIRHVMTQLKLPEGENWNASLVFSANACEYSRLYELARTVVASADAYQLKKDRRKALGKVILAKVRKNIHEPQLALPVFASIYLVRSLAAQGFAKLAVKTLDKPDTIDLLLTDSELVRERLKETRPKNEGIAYELKQVNGLRRRLLALIGGG
jgi:hypothetical protein